MAFPLPPTTPRTPALPCALTPQVVLLLFRAPLYTAAPKLSHSTDHVPAARLPEELQVLEEQESVGQRPGHRVPSPSWSSHCQVPGSDGLAACGVRPRQASSRLAARGPLTWVLWRYSWKARSTAPLMWISWAPYTPSGHTSRPEPALSQANLAPCASGGRADCSGVGVAHRHPRALSSQPLWGPAGSECHVCPQRGPGGLCPVSTVCCPARRRAPWVSTVPGGTVRAVGMLLGPGKNPGQPSNIQRGGPG